MGKDESQVAAPKVSVAMCTYNGANFVAAQLESILNQTCRDLEVIIVDDASTDETLAILERFQRQDARIRLLRNEVNQGFLKNFERALGACSADIIALADQDDIWFENKIEALLGELDDNLLVYSRVSLIDEKGSPLAGMFPSVRRLSGHCPLALVMNNCVTGHACLVRRELLDQALPFPNGIRVHDQWLAIVAASSGRLRASDQFLSLYRKHSNNAVLKRRGRRRKSRARQKMESDADCLALVGAMRASKLLDAPETALLMRFDELLQYNRRCFYNRQLEQFLMANKNEFLPLFFNPEKVVKKLCRGAWFYRLLPFA